MKWYSLHTKEIPDRDLWSVALGCCLQVPGLLLPRLGPWPTLLTIKSILRQWSRLHLGLLQTRASPEDRSMATDIIPTATALLKARSRNYRSVELHHVQGSHLDCGQRNFCFKCRAMVPAGTSAHGSLLSWTLCQSQAEIPLIEPVQKSRASSDT